MQNPWFYLKMATFFLAAWLISPLTAVAQTPLAQLLDSTTLTIPVAKAQPAGQLQKPIELEIPVGLSKDIKKPQDLLFQPLLVTLDGETRDLATFNFKLKSIPAPGLGIVEININPQLTATAGKYTVLVMPVQQSSSKAANPEAPTAADCPVRPAAPASGPPAKKTKSPAAGAAAAAAGGAAAKAAPPASEAPPGSLKFTFDRPAAELRLGPLRIIRQVVLPWWWSGLYPSTLLLSETGGKSTLTPEPQDLLIDLSLPDGQALPGRLKLSGLRTLSPWGQQQAQLGTEGWFGLGTAKGTFTIRSPELATRKADFQVELVSRAWLGWLVLILIGSIILGYLSRTVLEKRTKATEARLAGEEQRGLLKELIGKTVDDDLRGKLTDQLDELGKVIQSKADDPEALKEATTKAQNQTKELLSNAEKLRSSLAQGIDNWQLALESAGDQAPGVDQAIKQTCEWLAGLEKALKEGYLAPVETDLKEMENHRAGEIGRRGREWLAGQEGTLAQAKNWPEIDFDGEVKQMRNSIAALDQEGKEVSKPEILGEFLKKLGRLRWDLFFSLYSRRGAAILTLSEDILSGLEKIYPEAKGLSLDELREAQNEYRAALKVEAADNLPALVAAEGKLWDSLNTVLGQAWKALGKTEELAGLKEGNFLQAWGGIKSAKAAAERALGEEKEEEKAPPLEEKILPPPPPEPQPPLMPWRIRIQGPASVAAGERVTLELVVTAPPGQRPPDPVVRWYVVGDPRFKQQGGPGERLWHFTPAEPGRLVVRAEAEVAAVGDQQAGKQTAELALEVMPAEGFVATAELQKRLKKSERTQTLIYGLLITAVGFSIFRNSFVGTFEDILAAALWGFSIDIGVAKVREFATPLLAKAPKFPGA